MGHHVRIRSLEVLDPAFWGYLTPSGGVVGKSGRQRTRVSLEFGPNGSGWKRCTLSVSGEATIDEQQVLDTR